MTAALALGLALVALTAGLASAPGELQRWRRAPVLAALFAQLVLMPVLALLLGGAVQAPGPILAGLVLLAAAPGVLPAPVLAAIAGGDATLARSINVIGTALSAFTLPVMAGLLLPPSAGFSGAMLLLVLLPFAAGFLLRSVTPALAGRARGPLSMGASVVTGLLMLAALWQGGPILPGLWSAIALALLTMAVARTLAAVMALRQGEATALMMALPLRNVAVPIALAFGAGRPDWALAAACYGIAMFIPTLGLMALRLRRARG